MTISEFRKTVWDHYRDNRRNFPWRKARDPYAIMVSEIMLQQTQADRVVPKYISFLHRFPTSRSLAGAKLSDVLSEWQGLGYNRRALYLKKTCEMIESEFDGNTQKALKSETRLPGIGGYTRGAIRTFAFDEPHISIETNIRSAYIHHFFPRRKKVHDSEIVSYMRQSLDSENPREWYWALMDYGAYLKRTVGNPSRKSAHHAKQTEFEGSNRQLRSYILKELLRSPQTAGALHEKLGKPLIDIDRNLQTMTRENLVRDMGGVFSICN